MSLNPIQFGRDVLDQYGRYLLTTLGAELPADLLDDLTVLLGLDNAN